VKETFKPYSHSAFFVTSEIKGGKGMNNVTKKIFIVIIFTMLIILGNTLSIQATEKHSNIATYRKYDSVVRYNSKTEFTIEIQKGKTLVLYKKDKKTENILNSTKVESLSGNSSCINFRNLSGKYINIEAKKTGTVKFKYYCCSNKCTCQTITLKVVDSANKNTVIKDAITFAETVTETATEKVKQTITEKVEEKHAKCMTYLKANEKTNARVTDSSGRKYTIQVEKGKTLVLYMKNSKTGELLANTKVSKLSGDTNCMSFKSLSGKYINIETKEEGTANFKYYCCSNECVCLNITLKVIDSNNSIQNKKTSKIYTSNLKEGDILDLKGNSYKIYSSKNISSTNNSIKKGARIKILEISDNWLKIEVLNGKSTLTGNVYLNYNSTAQRYFKKAETKLVGKDEYYTSNLKVGNVLKFTGGSWKIYSFKAQISSIGSIKKNTKIEILEIDKEWLKIQILDEETSNKNSYLYYGENGQKYFEKTSKYYTSKLRVGDGLEFTGNSWYIYLSKKKGDPSAIMKKNTTFEILEIDKEWLKIEIFKEGVSKKIGYIEYGENGERYFEETEIEKYPSGNAQETNENTQEEINTSHLTVGQGLIFVGDSWYVYTEKFNKTNYSKVITYRAKLQILEIDGNWLKVTMLEEGESGEYIAEDVYLEYGKEASANFGPYDLR